MIRNHREPSYIASTMNESGTFYCCPSRRLSDGIVQGYKYNLKHHHHTHLFQVIPAFQISWTPTPWLPLLQPLNPPPPPARSPSKIKALSSSGSTTASSVVPPTGTTPLPLPLPPTSWQPLRPTSSPTPASSTPKTSRSGDWTCWPTATEMRQRGQNTREMCLLKRSLWKSG